MEGKDDGPPAKKQKTIASNECPHGLKCYRVNPHHFKEYTHSELEELINLDESDILSKITEKKAIFVLDVEKYLDQIIVLKQVKPSKTENSIEQKVIPVEASSSSSQSKTPTKIDNSTMAGKMQSNAPYNLFFTTICKSESTKKHPHSITFTDLLCPSLGELERSLQINFMIDIEWLVKQYKQRDLHAKPLTILCADEFPDMGTFINRFLPNVTFRIVQMSDPFGCHHSKLGIYAYADKSIRIVVSTANLVYEDWNHYNQGLWVSPALPRLAENSKETDGESATGFKKSFLFYLRHYKIHVLKDWIDYVAKADFSDVKVCFVSSVPGKKSPTDINGSHLRTVREYLAKHCDFMESSDKSDPTEWSIIGQSSSIGMMGKTPSEWLRSTFLNALASHKNAPIFKNDKIKLCLVYPTMENVARGYFGAEGGGCLPYSKVTNEKQLWLQQKFLYKWKSDELERTRAMPHIKSYCRISPCQTKLAYFLLTSANMSRAAWGNKTFYTRSYEAGVLFLPKFFNERVFELKRTLNSNNQQMFPMIYDLPLQQYGNDDYAYCR